MPSASDPTPETGSAESLPEAKRGSRLPFSLDSAALLREAPPVVVVCLVTVVAFWPNVVKLVRTWNTDPDYSHGFLVIPIALAILIKRWPQGVDRRPSLIGWVVVVSSLAARLMLHWRGSSWSESATLIPLIAGLGLARLGWGIFAKTWPAFVFLIFLLPLPPALNTTLSQPLQKIATTFSVLLLKATGLWVLNEGNIIVINSERLEVAEACNGLAMLMSLAATVVAAASLLTMSLLKRIILLLSVIPVALLSNVLRITATAWCYHLFGAKIGSQYAHDAAGYLMMPTAMALVGLELWIVSWLVVEDETEEQGLGLVPMGTVGTANLAGGPQ